MFGPQLKKAMHFSRSATASLGKHQPKLKDEKDIAREVRSLYSRCNTLIRKFGNLTLDVKCSLFKTYCTHCMGKLSSCPVQRALLCVGSRLLGFTDLHTGISLEEDNGP